MFRCASLAIHRSAIVISAIVALFFSRPALANDTDFFESKIRPLLTERCYSCHSAQAKKLKGQLYLDSRQGILTGGKDGLILVAGDPEHSRIIQAVRWTDRDLKMPPKERLTAEQVADLEEWVRRGAPDPRTGPVKAPGTGPVLDLAEARKLWAFHAPVEPTIPPVKNAAWCKSPIDRFILAALEEKGLKPAPPAGRRMLIRRAYFDLIGLPPTPAEVDAFLADESPDAFAKIVDRLLNDPRYGQRWARHWLDVVRYTDQFYGFNGAALCTNVWRYRDWVVKAFNEDLPYDQFIRLQVAGDLLANKDGTFNPDAITATEMYTIGNWPTEETDGKKMLTDIVDDQIDVTGRAFLGLTLACARCHDHKFDPISTNDYYGLAGIFFSSHFLNGSRWNTSAGQAPLERTPLVPPSLAKNFRDLDEHAAKLKKDVEKFRNEALAAKSRESLPTMDQYMVAAWEFQQMDRDGVRPTVAAFTTARKLDAQRFTRLLNYVRPIFSHDLPKGVPAESTLAKWATAAAGSDAAEVSMTARVLRDALVALDAEARPLRDEHKDLKALAGPDAQVYRDLTALQGPWGAFDKADDDLLPLVTRVQLAFQRGLLKSRQDALAEIPVCEAMAEEGLSSSTYNGIHDARIHIRGRYDRLGEIVPRHLPRLLAGDDQPPIAQGSGRLQLAEFLASEKNPLTARVMVNRIWQHHFDNGIVRTPSNFGKLGTPATNPELLDWLALEFIHRRWSIKAMQHEIMLSATYQQSSLPDPATLAADPEDLLFGWVKRRRLEAEAIRDTLLMHAGVLDLTPGGTAVTDPATHRRTLYVKSNRTVRSDYRTLFDAADTTAIVDQRIDSTVAPQALYLMNSSFVLEQSKRIAQRVLKEGPAEDRAKIEWLYQRLYSRAATEKDVNTAVVFLKQSQSPANGGKALSAEDAWEAYCQVLVCANEYVYVD